MTPARVRAYLGSIQPFKALAEADLNRLSAAVRVLEYGRGDTVYNEGETADSAWVIHTGRIQVLKYTTEGKPFAIESLGPGELFGTLCRLGGNGRAYPCTAVAAEPTVVLRILDRVFLEYYQKSPGFIHGLCSLCSDRLKDVNELRCLGQESVAVRMAHIIGRLYDVHGSEVPFTKKELSELVGATLETTFRVLGELEAKGLLASSRGKISVKKPADLKALVEKP